MASPARRAQLDPDLGLGAGKTPCRLSTVADDTLSGLAVRDGVTPIAGDRVLVLAQTASEDNGPYVAAAGAWARAGDFATTDDVDKATVISVSEGTANAKTDWMLTTIGAVTLGTTGLTFEIVGRAGNDPGAHFANHLPSGSDPLTSAIAVGLDGNTANGTGSAESFARSDHTHAIDDATGTNSTINAGDAAVDGTAVGFSKKDHQHPVATAVPTGAVEIGDTGVEGAASTLARADHVHPVAAPAAPANITKATAATGSAVEAARADHKHDVTTAVAVELAEANAEGSATTLARSDHAHDHGDRSGGTLHAAATTGVAGFMSAADKAKLDVLVDPDLIAPKDSVRLLSVADLATLSGNQTVDGVVTAPGERVALFMQSISTEDGIYDTNAGAWTRADDFALASGQAAAVFPVEEGTSNGDTFWQVTNDAGSDVVGTDDLAVLQIGAGSPRGAGAGLTLNVNDLDVVANADGSLVVNASDMQVGVLATDAQHGVRGGGTQHADVIAGGADGFMTGVDKTKLDSIVTGATATIPRNETVTTEAIIGTDTVMADVLNNIPIIAASLILTLNGQVQTEGSGEDYTVNVTTGAITWLQSTGTAIKQKTSDGMTAHYQTTA